MNGTSKSGKNTQATPDGTQSEKPQKAQSKDIFQKLKYVAYRRSQVTAGDQAITLPEFVVYAKHQVCLVKNLLFRDPIWESYTDEDILVEYFAMLFDTDEKYRTTFEKSIAVGDYQESVDWFDKQIEENQKDIKKDGKEQDFDFVPSDVMGDA